MRTLRLVRHLDRTGWAVNVLTLPEHSLRAGAVIDRALLDNVPPAVQVTRPGALRPFDELGSLLAGRRAPAAASMKTGAESSTPEAVPQDGVLSRIKRLLHAATALPDREVGWLLPATLDGWRSARRQRPDVIYSTGPPFTAHVVAGCIARAVGSPWVADFRDPWARAPWREDRFAFERGAWAMFERQVVGRCQAAVFVTETNRRDFAAYHGAAVASRFFVVSNGCDPAEFQGLARTQAAGTPAVLLHAGSLYGARNPSPLFRAVARAIHEGQIDRSRFRIRFIGRMGASFELPRLSRELGLENVVEFGDHVPRRDSLQQMLDATALLIVQPVTTVSIPAKLYEYMAAGRPILALAEPGGETSDLIQHTRAGVAVRADDEAGIACGLRDVLRMAREGFAPVDPRAYDGNTRAAELAEILSSVADVAARGIRSA
jgi:glycosyltransferase involved in cell wall biosynthesis